MYLHNLKLWEDHVVQLKNLFLVNWALSFSHFEFSQEAVTISCQKFTIANPLQMVLYKIITAVAPKIFMNQLHWLSTREWYRGDETIYALTCATFTIYKREIQSRWNYIHSHLCNIHCLQERRTELMKLYTLTPVHIDCLQESGTELMKLYTLTPVHIDCLQESGTELMKLYTLTPVQKLR